jgi:MarR family transcriptional regulator, lower aerobic nicotinate degradation pathway regulator
VVESTPDEAARLRNLPSRLLSMAATHADRRVNDALAARGARKWHYAVLATLAEFGPASQAELSERTRIYRSDLVAVINELTGAGLVERSADPDDRRRNVITMTEDGGTRLRELDDVLADAENEVLAALPPADREELTRLLTALVRHHRHG